MRSSWCSTDAVSDLRQRVIGDVFTGVQRRMESGYPLRGIINKVNGIHFDSSEEIHTLGHLYESMLKEMRDAAGDSGQVYTLRAIIRFIVEAYSYLEKQCKTVEQKRTLQDRSIHGQEAKPLPCMLCQMNLILHGLEAPRNVKGNSLHNRLTETKDCDRVGVILTNPPSGGEEGRGIESDFKHRAEDILPKELRIAEIMREIKELLGARP